MYLVLVQLSVTTAQNETVTFCKTSFCNHIWMLLENILFYSFIILFYLLSLLSSSPEIPITCTMLPYMYMPLWQFLCFSLFLHFLYILLSPTCHRQTMPPWSLDPMGKFFLATVAPCLHWGSSWFFHKLCRALWDTIGYDLVPYKYMLVDLLIIPGRLK